MYDISKYNFILGSCNKRSAVVDTILKTNVDITSIINGLEQNTDVTNLLINEETVNFEKLLHSIEDIKNNIQNVNFWIHNNLLPNCEILEPKYLNEISKQFNTVNNSAAALNSTTKEIKKSLKIRLEESHNRVKQKYILKCNVCSQNFTLHCDQDFDSLENHCHIGDILSAGKTFEPISELEKQEINVINTAPCEVIKSNNLISSLPITMTSSNCRPVQTLNLPFCKYNSRVLEILYPEAIMQYVCGIENNYNFYTIQAIQENRYLCIMCDADLYKEFTISQHVESKKHTRKIQFEKLTFMKLSQYHKIFTSLPEEYQHHQVMFKPALKYPFLFCKVCSVRVDENDVLNHIKTDQTHKQRILLKKFKRFYFYYEMVLNLYKEPISVENATTIDNKSKFIESSATASSSEEHKNYDTISTSLENLKIQNAASNMQTYDDITKNKPNLQGSSTTSSSSEEHKNCNKTILNTISCSSNEEMQQPSTSQDNNTSDEENDETGSSCSNNEEIEFMNNEKTEPYALKQNTLNNSVPSTSAQVNGTLEPPVVEHNIILSINEKPIKFCDLFEHRFQPHLKFMKFINDDTCHCTLCLKNVPKLLQLIKKHICTNEHIKNSATALMKKKYTLYCDLCFKYIRSEIKWAEHLSCIEHRQRLDVIQKNREPRGGPFQEYECTTCKVVLYGNRSSIKKHVYGSLAVPKKIKKQREIKLPKGLQTLLSNETAFETEINKLIKESEDVLRSMSLNNQCCRGIETALLPLFNQCKAYPFGSRVSGLGNIISDLDVFVDTGMMYNGLFFQSPEDQANLVHLTAKMLRKNRDFEDICVIPHARTPIVQVFHKATGLDCDLSFRHGLSVENTEFLKLCISAQPKLKSLILFLKKWSQLNKLNERISTYAVSMLCIFYVQVRGYLPSLTKLRQIDPTSGPIIAGWETYCFNKPITELNLLYPQFEFSLKNLLSGFFDFYINFNFNLEVVCPLLGRSVLKADFYEEKGHRLPIEMKTYVNKINESESNEVFRSMSPMCVQDPFDLSHNLTKACPIDFVKKFIVLCQQSQVFLNTKE